MANDRLHRPPIRKFIAGARMSVAPTGSPNDCFGGALRALLRDPKYQPVLKDLSYISSLLTVIDSRAPGASEALLAAVLAAPAPPP
jgi:hypothetical protein